MRLAVEDNALCKKKNGKTMDTMVKSGERIQNKIEQPYILQTIKDVRSCQSNNGIDSCLKCSKCLSCELRDNYVDVIFKAMNPNGGSFEF